MINSFFKLYISHLQYYKISMVSKIMLFMLLILLSEKHVGIICAAWQLILMGYSSYPVSISPLWLSPIRFFEAKKWRLIYSAWFKLINKFRIKNILSQPTADAVFFIWKTLPNISISHMLGLEKATTQVRHKKRSHWLLVNWILLVWEKLQSRHGIINPFLLFQKDKVNVLIKI